MDRLCYIILTLFTLLFRSSGNQQNAVTVSLSPSEDVPVCPGDELVVTCRATNLNGLTDNIIWTITTNIEGRQPDGDERLISALGQRTITPITLNMNTFIFTNKTHFNSDTNLVTLTSNVSVTVTDYLNGSVITCSTLDANSSVVFDTTTIHIIGNESNSNEKLIFNLFSVTLNEFEVESNISKTTSTNFTVTLSWEQDIGTHFTVHVVPDADLHFTKSTEVQLTMSYDVSHTVTIVGTRCGQNISRVVKEIFMSSSGNATVTVSPTSTSTSIIAAAAFSTLFGALLIFFVGAILTITIFMTIKRNRNRTQNSANDHIQSQQDNDCSEYSVLQHSVQCTKSTTKLEVNSKDKSHPSTVTLVYAAPHFSSKKQCVPVNCGEERVKYSQVNFMKKPTKVVNKMERHPADDLLNLDSLLVQLKAKVTPKWYQFGEAVGMDKETLDKYSQYPPDQCLIEVLDHWLRNHTGQPTWREVAEILRVIGLMELASAVENVYKTGRFPIQINVHVDDEFLQVPEMTSDLQLELKAPPIPPKNY